MANNFWTDGTIEPKRQNRWIVQFDGIHSGIMFNATKVGRPEIEVSNKEHKYLNHTFNYPGRVSWKPVNLTVVDLDGKNGPENTMENILKVLRDSGYVVPNNTSPEKQRKTIAKGSAISSLSGKGGNGVTISMVDAAGAIIETWTLKNAYITNLKPSELSYEGEDLAVVDLTITYDYCEYKGKSDLFKPGA